MFGLTVLLPAFKGSSNLRAGRRFLWTFCLCLAEKAYLGVSVSAFASGRACCLDILLVPSRESMLGHQCSCFWLWWDILLTFYFWWSRQISFDFLLLQVDRTCFEGQCSCFAGGWAFRLDTLLVPGRESMFGRHSVPAFGGGQTFFRVFLPLRVDGHVVRTFCLCLAEKACWGAVLLLLLVERHFFLHCAYADLDRTCVGRQCSCFAGGWAEYSAFAGGQNMFGGQCSSICRWMGMLFGRSVLCGNISLLKGV